MAKLRKIVLHGNLKDLYQGEIRLAVDTTAEAIRGLVYQIPNFRETLSEGHYRVTLGDYLEDNDIDESVMGMKLGNTEVIHITPVIEGAGRGAGKIILGVAMVSLAFVTAGTSLGVYAGAQGAAMASAAWGAIGSTALFKFGVALTLGGIAQALSPQVSNNSADRERPDQRPSFLFSGPVNTTQQGLPVPLCYGEVLTGSHIASAGLTTEDI